MTNISILPNKVWKVAVSTAKNYPCFGSVALGNIAEDSEKGIEVCMRYGDEFESDTVCVYVFHNGNIIYEKGTNSADECEKTVREVFKKYLSYPYDEDDEDDEDCEEVVELDDDEIDDAIVEREEELDQAVMDFLSVVLGEVFDDLDADSCGAVTEDCKEHFLEYIARKFSLPVFRPMYLEDVDTGEDFYTDSPYEEMVFEDADNPIYK